MKTQKKPAAEVVLSRVIDAPRERVFAAWGKPESLARWFAPRPYTLPHCRLDFRAGGKFRMAMRAPDGAEHWFGGEYKEVTPHSRLVWVGEFDGGPKEQMTTEIDFEAQGQKTKIHVRQSFWTLTPETKASIAGAPTGWGMTLDQLGEECASREIVVTRILQAPRERVWKAWSDPAEVVKWWGPYGFQTDADAREFRVGGTWRHTMVGPDGARYPNLAKFEEIVAPERIVYVNGGGRENGPGANMRTTVTFKAVGDATELTLRLVFGTPEERELVLREFKADEGGRQTLSRLAASVEGNFVASRLVDAPRERVWRAWTEPKALAAWMGPKGFETIKADLDLRPGGSYHYGIKGPSGVMWGLWEFRAIEAPARLEFVQSFSDEKRGLGRHPMAPDWPRRTLSTIVLTDLGAKTLVTVLWQPYEATESELKIFRGAMESMHGGWKGTFERLDQFLASGA